MTKRLTFANWAGLQTGRIASIYLGKARISWTRTEGFKMEKGTQVHTLEPLASHERVAAHFASFAKGA